MAREVEEGIAFLEKVKAFEDWVGKGGLGNVRQYIEALRRDLEAEKKKVAEFVEISQTTEMGAAKKRFRALMRKQKVEHDLTLIGEVFQKVSSTWLDGVVGKKGISAEAPISVKRAKVEHESLIPFVIKLYELCEQSENGQKIIAEFEQDYVKMGRTQFTTKLYKYVEHIFEVQEEEELSEVALVDAIPLCEGYYPEQLLNDFIACGEALGTISATLFTLLDTAVATGGEQAKVAVRKVLTRALHRASGNQGDPTIQVENTYTRLLSTKEDCPWGEDWVVQDTTRLADLLSRMKLERVK
jgi:hypothetical protein